MSFTRDPKVTVSTAPSEVRENAGGGPLANAAPAGYRRNVQHVPARSRLERVGFWVVVVAALALLLLLLGWILPPLVGGLVTGTYMGLFVGGLTLLNLRRPSGWANSVMGRRVFPVLQASDGDNWRLAGVDAALTLVFAFFFHVIAAILGPLLAGLIVFGGLAALGIFYNRARKVIIRP